MSQITAHRPTAPIEGRSPDRRMGDSEAAELLGRYRATGDVRYRNEVVDAHRWLAVVCARRMVRRSEALDDLVQVASIGILKAADRFDPEVGVLFRTFASATAMGELRRHYRSTWRMRVSRSVQELHLETTAAIERLTEMNQRTPTLAEVATYLDRRYEDVANAAMAGANHRPRSFAALPDDGREDPALGVDDDDFERVLDRQQVKELVDRLPQRNRNIVLLRYVYGMSQNEIAEQVGHSQVHVSRLLRSSLERMRSLAAVQ